MSITKQRHLERKLRQVERAGAKRFGMRSNPRIKFGRPCIPGTGLTCSAIYGMFSAGDNVEYLAEQYGHPVKVIQQAIRCGMWLEIQFYICEECAEFG